MEFALSFQVGVNFAKINLYDIINMQKLSYTQLI